MGLDKKELDKVVAFVKKVKELPGNEEFIADLRMVLREKRETKVAPPEVSVTNIVTTDATTNPKIEAIEKYLGLDYQLDVTTPSIDYSFITNAEVRNQLVSDYREMLRCRYGTRGHRVDFFEFCRYVQLQSEALLNYYYNVKSNSGEEENGEDSEENKTTYQTILHRFCSTNKIKSYTLDYVRSVRNIQSHRTAQDVDINSLIALVKKFAKDYDIKFYSKNTIDTKDVEAKNLSSKFKEEFKMSERAYNYKVNLEGFIHDAPYADIIGALNELANTVAKNITTE